MSLSLIVLALVSFAAVAAEHHRNVNPDTQKIREAPPREGHDESPAVFLEELGSGFDHTLASAVQAYLTAYGPEAFLDEIYNLLGNQPIAKVNAANRELADALGVLWALNHGRNVEVKESTASKSFLNAQRAVALNTLSRFFGESRVGQNLPEHQRYFLEWHFGSDSWYRRNLRNADRTGIVSWNTALYARGDDDLTLYTFGLIGCTVIFAEADDGAVFMAHTEGMHTKENARDPVSHLARIRERLKLFSDSRRIVRLRTLGYYAKPWLEFLRKEFPATKEVGWFKPDGGVLSHASTIRFRRYKGAVTVDLMRRPIGNEYLGSIYPNVGSMNAAWKKGEIWPDFGYAGGRASLIFPSDNLTFIRVFFCPDSNSKCDG